MKPTIINITATPIGVIYPRPLPIELLELPWEQERPATFWAGFRQSFKKFYTDHPWLLVIIAIFGFLLLWSFLRPARVRRYH